jgi:hypothetical protein
MRSTYGVVELNENERITVVGLRRVELPTRGLGNRRPIRTASGGQFVASRSQFPLLFLAMQMSGSVTARAKGNEVFFGIVTEPATRSDVVDLKIPRRAAILAAPSIAHEHLVG